MPVIQQDAIETFRTAVQNIISTCLQDTSFKHLAKKRAGFTSDATAMRLSQSSLTGQDFLEFFKLQIDGLPSKSALRKSVLKLLPTVLQWLEGEAASSDLEANYRAFGQALNTDSLMSISVETDVAAMEAETVLQAEQALNRAQNSSSKIHEGQLSVTHGFVPHQPIPMTLPTAYAAWDDLAEHLSEYLAQGTERQHMAHMPVLTADDIVALPDEYLARAAAILGNAAHAYYFNQRKGSTQQADPLPDSIRVPWEQIYKRLGRPLEDYQPGGLFAARNHYDAFLNNWRLKDGLSLDGHNNLGITIDDIELLTPFFDSLTERHFVSGMILTEIRFGAAIQPIMQALHAVSQGNDAQLIEALTRLTQVVEKLTEAIDFLTANEHSRYYIDPTVWTKTIAKADGAIPGELPGVSGNSLPMFQVLDCLIERAEFNSPLGQSLVEKFKMQPQLIADFIRGLQADLSQHSLKTYIESSNNIALKTHYASFIKAYVDGFLEVHAIKAYGFMTINFKNGRLVTNGAHEGTVHSNPEREIHADFMAANAERRQPHQLEAQYAARVSAKVLSAQAAEVTLDLRDSGIHLEPGDRLAITPQNSSQEQAFIVNKYQLSASQVIDLSPAWQTHLTKTYNLSVNTMTLGEWLAYVDLAPWRDAEVTTFSIEACRPLAARLYSASPMIGTSKARLTVGLHNYTDSTGHRHSGVASHYLTQQTGPVRVSKAAARFFHLPHDASRPIIMFAAGTGIAPFMGFIDARREQTGHNWLFYSVQNQGSFYHADELAKAVGHQHLTVSAVFSREALTVSYDEARGRFRYDAIANSQHIDQAIGAQAQRLAELILKEGAYIYVCGNAGFAKMVRQALNEALAQDLPNEHDRLHYLDALEANHRYNQDVFSSPTATHGNRGIMRSEVAKHSHKEDCWVIYGSHVYDMTRLMSTHPGGYKIIQVRAGTDGSADYYGIGHHLDPQIEALLAQYRVGTVAMPTLTEGCQTLYPTVVNFLDTLLEVRNTLANNAIVSDDQAPYVWRETYSVFIEGSLASYAPATSEAAEGSFKYLFGRLLPQLYEAVGLPTESLTAIYQELAMKSSACAAYLRLASSQSLPADTLKVLKHAYHGIIQATFALLDAAKKIIIEMLQAIEISVEHSMVALDKILQNIEIPLNAYLSLMQRTYTAFSIPDDIHQQAALICSSTSSACPFAHGKKLMAAPSPTTVSESTSAKWSLPVVSGIACCAASIAMNGCSPPDVLKATLQGVAIVIMGELLSSLRKQLL